MKFLFRKNVSAWNMTGLLASGARWFFGLSILPSNTDNNDTWVLKSEYDRVVKELENERMRLAACGVVAMSDTRESAMEARKMLPGYDSASCQDISRKIDELIELREKLESLKHNKYVDGQQYIVCAAARNTYNGDIICSPRHYDATFYNIFELYTEENNPSILQGWHEADQGFVDQFGKFLTRAEARKIAVATNQIRRRCGGDHEELYSENLY